MRLFTHARRPVAKVIAVAVALVMLGGFATIGLAAASPGGPSANPQATLTYTTLALINGWSNYGFGTRKAAVSKDASGVVHFKGAIATAGSSDKPFTLPKAFWPGATVYVTADMCSATSGRLVITKTGVVSVEAENLFSNATCFTSLEGISYGP